MSLFMSSPTRALGPPRSGDRRAQLHNAKAGSIPLSACPESQSELEVPAETNTVTLWGTVQIFGHMHAVEACGCLLNQNLGQPV